MRDLSKLRYFGKTMSRNRKNLLKLWGVQLGSAAAGFFAAHISLLSALTPLGVVITAALPGTQAVSGSIGAFLGYLLFSGGGMPFRYIAALFAVVSIRMITGTLKKISDAPAFCAMVTLVSMTVCNLVAAMTESENILLYLCEGVLGGGLTYFASRALHINRRSGVGFTGEELASAVITLNMILLGLLPVTLFGFSLGRVLTVTLILIAARYGSVAGGTICATAVGFAVALGQNDAKMVCLYAVSGLISGLFSAGGKAFCILGYLVPSLISLGVFGVGASTVVAVLEIVVGAALFLLLPKSVCMPLAAFFMPPTKLQSLEGMRKSLVMRLNEASGALCDVSGTIDEVAKRLKRINAPDPSALFTQCENEACAGCSFRLDCWETNRKSTLRSLGKVSTAIREGKDSPLTAAPEFFDKCLRKDKLFESLNRRYKEYLNHLCAEDRIEQVRGVVSDQFDGISDMLLDLATEFDTARSYDLDTAETVVSALREIGLLTTDCGCSIDKYGRMSIEFKLHKTDSVPNRRHILEQLESACERRFEPPTLREVGEVIYVTVLEKAVFLPEIGVCQIPATETGICGDAYTCFGDGNGRYILLLSDGMGTGGRAAVDGAMTSGLLERLIKAGFGFDCSLRIVNSALLYKSTEESLSTVDIACIDLYTGETGLFKAGAAPTFVKRSGRVGRAQSHSLPVGILRDVGFDRSSLTLKRDDMVVLCSDGATTDGTDWICKEIENCEVGSAQQLADRIAEAAARRADAAHPDDITVMVALLNKKP